MRPPLPQATPCVLLTGFEPFGGEQFNASWEVVRALHDTRLAGVRIVSVCLPCVFDLAREHMAAALREHDPVLVIAVGQAAARDTVSLERIAINLIDAPIADNAGQQPVDIPVIAGAPPAYFSTLPLKAMLRAMSKAGIPASLSLSAGSYVCNEVFYALMHGLAEQGRATRQAGFIHVPCLDVQALEHPGRAWLALPLLVEALRLAVSVALASSRDDFDVLIQDDLAGDGGMISPRC